MRNKFRPKVLTIAGFDPSSGAGLSADLKTFEINSVYGFATATAITIQNENSFKEVIWTNFGTIKKQIEIIFSEHNIEWVKIGLIKDFETLSNIIDYLISLIPSIKIIWDPILKSSTNFEFHNSLSVIDNYEILKKLFLITPNKNELKSIFLKDYSTESIQLEIRKNNLCNILITGGHNESNANDCLITKNFIEYFDGKKFNKNHKHGSGCVYSSALLSNLAKGIEIRTACLNAKKYTERFLQSNETKLGYHENKK